MKDHFYNSLFDSLRSELPVDDYLSYLLLNEIVKKIAATNQLSLPELWKDVLTNENPVTGLSGMFRRYEQDHLAHMVDSLHHFPKVADQLADFSVRTRHEPPIREEEFLEIYERFLSTRTLSMGVAALGIPTMLFNVMHSLAGTKEASSVYDGTLYQVNNLISGHLMNREAKIYAETPDETEKMIADMLSFLYFESRAHIEQGNVLLQPSFTKNDYELRKFDSIVMAPPMGHPLKEDYTQHDRFGRFIYGRMGHRDSTFGYIAHAIAAMEEKGKACVMVSSAPLFRGGKEEEIRKKVLQQDLIEGIVQLPAFILLKSGMAPFLIVLNKNKSPNDKGKVKLLDASDIFTQEGRRKVLNEESVQKILQAFTETEQDSSFCRKVTVAEVIENASNLMPEKYFLQENMEWPGIGKVNIDREACSAQKTVALEELADISNGVNIRPSEEGTIAKVIKASDIQDGELFLEQIEEQTVDWKKNYEKGVVRPGDLLMLSKGTNVKMAVMPETEEAFIASVNLMIIRPKPEVNPYFLQVYLESPIGQWELERIKAGTVIATWPLREFRKIPIPALSEETQNHMAEDYLDAKKAYREALVKAEKEKEKAQLEIYEKMGLFTFIKKTK